MLTQRHPSNSNGDPNMFFVFFRSKPFNISHLIPMFSYVFLTYPEDVVFGHPDVDSTSWARIEELDQCRAEAEEACQRSVGAWVAWVAWE
jgi:hypothetical protein